MALTGKQKRFCEEYVIDLNATQAAIRAGYSEATAHSIGSENLTKPEVKDYVIKLQASISNKNGDLAQRVIDEFKKIGFSNIQDYLNEGNNVVDLTVIDVDKAAAVSSVKKSVTTFGDGEGNAGEKNVVEFKLWDKISALEKIGRHLGIFEKDNSQSKPEVAQPFTDTQVDKIISSLRQKNETT